jgi:ABC-type sulfate/molybdate transport systems ATPase subunit
MLLMDEPFGALDNQTRVLMQELLLGIWEAERKTVLFVTHDIDEAIFMANRVVVFSARPGRIKTDLAVDCRTRAITRSRPRPSSPESVGRHQRRAHGQLRMNPLRTGLQELDAEQAGQAVGPVAVGIFDGGHGAVTVACGSVARPKAAHACGFRVNTNHPQFI